MARLMLDWLGFWRGQRLTWSLGRRCTCEASMLGGMSSGLLDVAGGPLSLMQ